MSQTTLLAEGNFLIPDATFLVELFAFVIILAVMFKFVVPPLRKSMAERQAVIRKQLEDSREAKQRLDAAEADYKTMMSEARAEAAQIRNEAHRLRQDTVAAASEEARAAAESVTRAAEERLAVERDQVVARLRDDIGRLAVELAEKIVGESLQDEQRQTRVVERFLAELEEQQAGTAGGSAG